MSSNSTSLKPLNDVAPPLPLGANKSVSFPSTLIEPIFVPVDNAGVTVTSLTDGISCHVYVLFSATHL